MASFFTYFTSGIGTMVLVAVLVSVVTGHRVETGLFGVIGFPILALLYALSRKAGGRAVAVESMLAAGELHDVFDHPLYPEFLAEDAERAYVYKEDLPDQFAAWLGAREAVERLRCGDSPGETLSS